MIVVLPRAAITRRLFRIEDPVAVGEMVCIVNRVWFPLTVTKNGSQRTLQPGENFLTADWVRFAKLQNPRMGSFTPGTIDGDYIVGVKDVDNCEMISPEDAGLGKEKFDRAGDIADGKVVTVQQTGIRPPTRMSDPLPDNSQFGSRTT